MVIGRLGGTHIGTLLDTSAAVARWNPRSPNQLKYIRQGYSKLIVGMFSNLYGSLTLLSFFPVASRLTDPTMGDLSSNDVYDRDTFNSPELYHGIKLGELGYDGEYQFRVPSSSPSAFKPLIVFCVVLHEERRRFHSKGGFESSTTETLHPAQL